MNKQKQEIIYRSLPPTSFVMTFGNCFTFKALNSSMKNSYKNAINIYFKLYNTIKIIKVLLISASLHELNGIR